MRETTPFPNILIDQVMPHLKDTEWRLLCVIVRQTLGWKDKCGKGRKARDWLTQTQLVQKTGRDRAALSRALNVLVSGRYIEVTSEEERLLVSPAVRRQHRGRLFYALHPRLFAEQMTPSRKSKYQTIGSNSLLAREESKNEYQPAPKANTTKETQTKENETKRIYQNSLARLATATFHETPKEPDKKSTQEALFEPEYSVMAQHFITLFKQLYERTKNKKAGIKLLESDAERLEKLLFSRSSFDWTPVLQDFFASDGGYITRRDHSISAFLDSCHIFLMQHLAKTSR